MRNNVAAGRSLAFRIVWLQFLAAILVGAGFYGCGWRWSVSAASSAIAAASGSALFAATMFSKPAYAGVALNRFLIGSVLKWVLVAGGLIMILVEFKLPPLAAVIGLVAAYAVNLWALRFKG